MKKLWGGRFKKGMHPLLKCFSYSLAVDADLFPYEIQVDKAWAKMLGSIGLTSRAEASRLVRGLDAVAKELRSADPHRPVGRKWLEGDYEDIHTLIQSRLEAKVGPLAKKIHTGRSRNDLVVTSTRLYLREKNRRIQAKITAFQKSLVQLAKKAGNLIIPGMTHMRKAQPVLLAHHLLAYVVMVEGDRSRLQDAEKRIDLLPLGSAALAGSSLPINQKLLARELGFTKIATNSLAATSDRALVAETVSGLALLWMHLSRLSEDFILWNSEAFGYIDLDDEFATGSSLMPQKKNPDIFELVRGRAPVVFSHLQALLGIQKGLPLAYNRDLQEDKPALFDAVKKTELALEILAPAVSSVSFHPDRMKDALSDDTLFATDILEYLVRKGMPFTEAHETVGKAVRFSVEAEKPLSELSLGEWKRFSPRFDSTVYDLFDAVFSIRQKKTIGSTHPNLVKKEIVKWEQTLKSRE